ncbi:SLAP domain-containing protein [Gracilibacillus caseinilyticus]|uniref:SLAP domain-containing protein n=1 Tax=Gracilibacillus caseinilyticus TaxID=2932256 RepID=A0ABY4F0U6_9BACI|nr:SLAP domain-containing protein [Gracilibacillus caseinilyticus]UOQ50290.1 SLAP domain-containing protein [Gracilibacillus caseinilyticus]
MATVEQLAVSILIRNGSKKNLTISSLPLALYDREEELVAEGLFKVDQLEVKNNTSNPRNFIFPTYLLKKDIADIDLSQWTVKVVEKTG